MVGAEKRKSAPDYHVPGLVRRSSALKIHGTCEKGERVPARDLESKRWGPQGGATAVSNQKIWGTAYSQHVIGW